MQLETQRLLIKALTDADAVAVLKVYAQSQDFFELQSTEPPSIERVRTDIQSAQPRGSLFVGLFERATGELIGVADFIPKNFRGQSDYAWLTALLIRESDRRKGYGREAYHAIEQFIFDDPAVKRIGHALIPQYAAGLAFAEKMGFERAGGPFKNKRGYGLYSFIKKRPGLPETPGEKFWHASQHVLKEP